MGGFWRVRKGSVALATVALGLSVGGCGSHLGRSAGPTSSTGLAHLASRQCKSGDPLNGVYLPSRLTVKQACTTVSGTVDCVEHELDGDVHIRLRLDAAYARFLTAANAAQRCSGHPGPHLVVEIIPQTGHLPFLDNSATRGGFATPAEPAVGAHVTVTGPLVWDSDILHDLVHPGQNTANWAEIHPAWNITAGP